MRVLFLNPLFIHARWPILSDTKRVICRGIGVVFPQLAAMIDVDGCRIFDAFVEKISIKDYIKMLSEYDVIAMSMVPPHLALNMEITVRLIKMVSPQTKVILGGHHATAYAKEWVEKGVDIVVKHEGEITFKEVINILKSGGDLSSVEGIAFKSEGRVIDTPQRELIESLDDLPLPRWDLVNFEASRGSLGNNKITAFLETSRGCVASCDFCWVHWMWKKRQRYKSLERVMKELKILYDFGVRTILIADDNFGSNAKRDVQIFKEIITSGMKLDIWMFNRADSIMNNPEVLEYAGKAGAREVFVGFESVDVEKVDGIGKNLHNMRNMEDYKKVYDIAKKNNILVVGCFLKDLLDEEQDDVKTGTRYFDICDMSQHTQVIPLKDSPEYKRLWQTRFKGVDPFYAGILSGYELNDTGRNSINLRNLSGLLNLKMLKMLFSKDKSYAWARVRITHQYWSILKNIFDVSWKKIIIFLWCANPFICVEKKQKIIINQYLNDKFLSNLAGRKAGRKNQILQIQR
jgi:hypothetical protein